MVKKHLHKQGEPNVKARQVINMAIGSLNKIPALIDEKRYCPDIIQQLDSVAGLLKRARIELLRGHLDTCLVDDLKQNKTGAVKELLKVYNMH